MAVMANRDLLVDFWEVGQGDCTVIHLPDGQLILIDVGPVGSPVVDWLARQPGRRIHSIVITHNDSDHVGALTSLVDCCRNRIGVVYVMADRNVHEQPFRDLFRRLDQAWKAKEIGALFRLEAPITIWSSPVSSGGHATGEFSLDVRHPTLSANVLTSSPNDTSAVIVLTTPSSETLLWAGDTSVANVAAVASGTAPSLMLGPHHGAPIDRHEKDFAKRLKSIGPRAIVASVGTGNRYRHPCVNYIRNARRAGATFVCTQLTKQCEKPGRLRHVFKGAALLGLPQARKGFSCRGTIRLVYDGTQLRADAFAESAHGRAVKLLTRPKCIPSY